MEETLRRFLEACAVWVCDGYSLRIRYAGAPSEVGHELWSASIALTPLPPTDDNALRIALPGIDAGYFEERSITKSAALALITEVGEGRLSVHGNEYLLAGRESFRMQSTVGHRNLWAADLQLRIFGGELRQRSSDILSRLDDSLRTFSPPFDGLNDLGRWLGLPMPESGNARGEAVVRVLPPLAIIYDRSQLSGGRLRVTIHAHPTLDPAQVGLAVRFAPEMGLVSRLQVGSRIAWSEAGANHREGTVEVEGSNADAALVILTLGYDSVQRQWIIDPERAGNPRLLVAQHFDKDLRRLRQGLFDTGDSQRFERAVNALFFLMGFGAAIQLESDAPDLVAATPGHRLLLIECTIRTADIATKVGKLVDRRASIAKALRDATHQQEVTAVLVCRQPKDQIVVHSALLQENGVVLVAGEDLSEALERARFATDPDAMLAEAKGAQRQAPGTDPRESQ